MRTGSMTTMADVERQNLRSIERVYHLWDEALGAKDADAAAALYGVKVIEQDRYWR